VLNICGQVINQEDERIASLLSKVEKENRIVDELVANNLTNLPVGIKKTISGTKVVIAIDSARITPQGMIITACTQVKLPGTTRPISFAARNVLITPSGITQTGATRLVLISESVITLNNQVKLILPADGRNYIEWDCNGFRSVNLKGIFEFSDQYFTPDPELSGNKSKVTAGFEVNTSDFNNILISTSIDPFRVNGLGEITFVVRDAVADLSDYANCSGFVAPDGYKNIFYDAPELWRGFFLKELTVLLPSELSSGSERKAISANNLLIDEFGISGYFSATNILPISKGNASGWPFSVDLISIAIEQNMLTGGEIEGAIGIPFLANDTLGYFAQISGSTSGLKYNFSVATNTSRDYSIPFGGTIRLDKGCIFGMEAENGKFIPSAILNGTLSIQKEIVKLEALRFEGVRLTAKSPYVSGGTFSSSAGVNTKLAGFDLEIKNVSLGVVNGEAVFGFDVRIALMNKSEKGISARTRFLLNASVQEIPDISNPENPEQKWTYSGLLIEKVIVKGNVSIFSINGGVDLFRDNPVYGDGFHGNVGLMINKILNDTARVEIYFGTKVNFKYWYAKIDIPTNLPLGSAITLNKLAGGAYNNMEKKDLLNNGTDYVPKENGGLGFIAQAGFYVKDKELFNADVRFEIAFNKNNGVRFIQFTGNGNFFSKTAENAKPGEIKIAPVSASVNMIFDNENDIFHANLKVYMNLASAIKGIGPDGLLGEAVIHCDPSDWYIYVGRPSLPLGVSILGFTEAQTYFMAGTRIENMPLPPSEVASIVRNINMDFMKNENGVATGRGVAFGLRFNTTAGIGKQKGFVYAYFNAGAGADIMLRSYGSVQCAGYTGPIGINGWYASGQGYAYLTGKIGVRVKKAEFDIMSVATALLLQVKMPNPTWFQGNIAARYSILGGLVKGKVNVAVTLGEQCVLVTNGDELGDIKLIGDIEPADGHTEVDVFAAPQVSFNTNIGKEFGIINMIDQYAVYRVKFDYLKLLTADNNPISGILQWNSAQDLVTLKMPDILPGKQHITLSVKVHVEKKSKSGLWEALTSDSDSKESKFVTGEEPKSIPANNVVYSYPLNNQYNFYRNEYSKGYIKLRVGQPNLFIPKKDGNIWSYTARFKSNNGRIAESLVTYSEGEAMVYFDIPKTLGNSLIYEMTLVKKSMNSGAMDQNLLRSEVILKTKNINDSLSITKNELNGSLSTEDETVLHTCAFRTSIYSTFAEKLNSITAWNVQSAVDITLMSLPYIKITSNETFDKYEIEGRYSDFEPLVFAEAERGTSWIDYHVNPQVYELYGRGGITLNRNTDLLGVLPLKAMVIFNSGEKGYLLDGTEPASKKGDVFIGYHVPHYVYTDFSELRNKAAAMYLGKNVIPDQAQRLLAGRINDITSGSYPFKINYRLPGLNIITTSKEFKINY
jgi:hypothetical protein